MEDFRVSLPCFGSSFLDITNSNLGGSKNGKIYRIGHIILGWLLVAAEQR
jgi:hypothetical protein